MVVERHSSATGTTSLMDVLDRVLDKGIVVDAWIRVSLVGIDLVTVEARVVVASIDTYLRYAEAIGVSAPVSRSVFREQDERGAVSAPDDEPEEQVEMSGQGQRRASRQRRS